MSTSDHNHGHGHGGEGASAESVAMGFELSDWQLRPVVVLLIATFSLLALAFIAMAGLIFVTGGEVRDTSQLIAEESSQLPPEPRVEQNPTLDSARMIAEARAQLESYGWVDQGQGIVHIPIERAKQLLLERGVSNAFPGAASSDASAP